MVLLVLGDGHGLGLNVYMQRGAIAGIEHTNVENPCENCRVETCISAPTRTTTPVYLT